MVLMEYLDKCFFYATTVILPLRILFHDILSTFIHPDMWKLADVTPIFKKGDKQLIKNYRPIPLLPIFGKTLKEIFFNNLTTI